MDSAAFFKSLASLPRLSVSKSGEGQVPDGRHAVAIGCSGTPQQAVLALDNKRYRSGGPRFDSVSALVRSEGAELIAASPFAALLPMQPREVVGRVHLIVENASPDSLMAAVLLLAMLSGLAPDVVPEVWIDAVDDWERTGVVEAPERSWAALASALTHAVLTRPRLDDQPSWSEAWRQGLGFAGNCLAASDIDPWAMGRHLEIPQWRLAEIALRQEQRMYHDALEHAGILQLVLPTPVERGLLVDALLITEDTPTGATKVFYRNDRENSPLKEGFTLAVVYRPSLAGTGNDITISVDPRKGVLLTSLWHELERREVAAWAAKGLERPADAPRQLANVQARHNEPWFINPDQTLIAAPHAIPPHPHGTLLDWREVLDVLFALHHPLRDVRVRPYPSADGGEATVTITDLRPVRFQGTYDKVLLMAEWPEIGIAGLSRRSPRSLTDAPVVERILAALIRRRDHGSAPRLADLPLTGWQTLRLDGGLAVLTKQGVFVLDDWRDAKLDLAEARSSFETAAGLDMSLRELERDELPELRRATERVLQGSNWRWRESGRLRRACAEMSIRLARLRSKYTWAVADPNIRVLSQAIDEHWGLTRRLADVEQSLRTLEAALQRQGAMRQESIISLIGVPGFLTIAAFEAMQAVGSLVDALKVESTFWSAFWIAAPLLVLPVAFVAIAWWLGRSSSRIPPVPNAVPSQKSQ